MPSWAVPAHGWCVFAAALAAPSTAGGPGHGEGAPATTPAASLPCEGPEADPWLRDFRDRVASYDGLYRFAVGRFGAPTSCEGEITLEFDGARFGTLELGFDAGVTYTVETLPPEGSVRVLSASGGFADAEAVREAVTAHTADVGLDIDWTAPEVATEDGLETRTFWDPEPGLNASATLVFSGGRLMSVRVGLAP